MSTAATGLEERAARAEAEINIERNWRIDLQERETKLKEKNEALHKHIKELKEEIKQKEKLKAELDKARQQWSEAQTTLEELGLQLSVSKLKVSELQEREKNQHQLNSSNSSMISANAVDSTTAGIWAPDSIATHCTSCQKEFNLTRRKHHCRSCGDIFCRACSEHTLPLLNESGILGKPVRVCDSCFSAHK